MAPLISAPSILCLLIRRCQHHVPRDLPAEIAVASPGVCLCFRYFQTA